MLHHYTDIMNFRRCHRLYYLSKMYEPKKVKGALAWGSLIHQVLETYYKGQESSLIDVFNKAATILINNSDEPDKLIKEAKAFAVSLKEYQDYDFLHPLVPVKQNGNSLVETRLTWNGWAMTIDMVAEYEGELWIVDHKTGRIADRNTLLIDEQTALYSTAVKELFNLPISGNIHNYISKEGIARKKQYKNPAYQDRLAGNLAYSIKDIETLWVMDKAMTAHHSNSNPYNPFLVWRAEPSFLCSQFNCQFFDVCLAELGQAYWISLLENHFTRKNPEEEHEVYMKEMEKYG